MKVLRRFAFLVAATALQCAFADANNLLISFSTTGPDRYADGSPVLDGEWYALVWSRDGNFDGFTSDCGPVDADDAVVIVAPLAEGGRCPFTVFQIGSRSVNYKSSGKYAVYLFDTRSADRCHVAKANAEGRPEAVHGSVKSVDYTASAAASGTASSVGGSAVDGWSESAVDDTVRPQITAFAVNGAKVEITVENLLPACKYNVKMGGSPSELDSYGLAIPKEKDGDKPVKFELYPEDARFFQIVREPLVNPLLGQ